MSEIGIAIIGYGYWGPNLVRNFNSIPQCKIKYVCDFNTSRLSAVNKQYPNIITNSDYETVLNDSDIDAVIIATPVFTHFELAKKALLKNKNVLIEKPMTSTSAEAIELYELSKKTNKLLMVDHTFLYTSSVQKMKELIVNEVVGNIKYFD